MAPRCGEPLCLLTSAFVSRGWVVAYFGFFFAASVFFCAFARTLERSRIDFAQSRKENRKAQSSICTATRCWSPSGSNRAESWIELNSYLVASALGSDFSLPAIARVWH